MAKKTKQQLSDEEREKAEISVWMERIERSKKLRKRKLKEVKKYIAYYKSNQWGDLAGYKEKPVVNLFFSHIKSQIPFLYFQNPKWYVRPKPGHKKYAANAETATNYLNYYANENLRITLKRQMRLAILDAFFFFGVVKSGYTAEVGENKNYGKPKIIGYKGDKEIYDVDEMGKVALDDEEEVVVSDKFCSRRISPACILVDTECQNYIEDGRYIIEEISLPLEDVKKDKRYKHTDSLKPSYSLKLSLSLSEEQQKEARYSEMMDDLKRITIYEIWDLERKKLKVIAEGEKNHFLRNEETPEGVEGHPYSFLSFNDIPDEVYPLSDLRVLRSPQDEANKSLSMISAHAKRYSRKFGYIEGMIDEEEIAKVESPEDGVMFKVKELPLDKVIAPLQGAPLDQAVYMFNDLSRQNFDKLAATTEADRGAVERRKTAYEAQKIYASGDFRKEDRRSQVEDFAADVGMKLLQAMQVHLTPEDASEISEEDAKNWMVITDRKDIEGQFNVGVIVGSATPKLPETERQEFMQFMTMLTQFPPEMVQVKVNLDALLTIVPKLFPSLEDIEMLNPPEVQKQKQEQIDKQKQMEQLLELAQIQSKHSIGKMNAASRIKDGKEPKPNKGGKGGGNAPV